ncbi:MAG: hypothetical protein NBV56_01540 [Aquirufa antheringensis]|nr:hypothetical protein [Aquirufa antheringensis]
MRKYLLILFALLLLNPKQAHSQNTGAIAGAAAGLLAVGAGIVASIDDMKERAELKATQHILMFHPELQSFSLKTLDFDGKKLKDMSSVSVISYKIQEFIPGDEPKLTGKKQVLFGFTSYGWISEQGIDFNKVQWFLIDQKEWLNMMVAYAKVSSSEKNESILKQKVTNGLIANKGVKVDGKIVVPFYKLEGDMYLSTDYSDNMKLVYNERSLGIFLKKTMNLVQIGRSDLIKTHEFFFEKN